MHPEWLSNAYLVWDEGTREAFFVDSGGPLEPLLEVVEREGLEVKALLTTHTHGDHVAGDAELERRFGVQRHAGGRLGAVDPDARPRRRPRDVRRRRASASRATCSSRTPSAAATRRACTSPC